MILAYYPTPPSTVWMSYSREICHKRMALEDAVIHSNEIFLLKFSATSDHFLPRRNKNKSGNVPCHLTQFPVHCLSQRWIFLEREYNVDQNSSCPPSRKKKGTSFIPSSIHPSKLALAECPMRAGMKSGAHSRSEENPAALRNLFFSFC